MEGSPLKVQLRKDMRLRRNSISPSLRKDFDLAINQAVLDLVRQESITSLSAYLPFDGEPDLQPALNTLVDGGIKVYLPVITQAGPEKALQFHRWRPGSELRTHPLGLLEPTGIEAIAITNLDLLLMPLVAWDEHGRRVGMGAGYYDRALSDLADSVRPMRTGIAYQAQKCTELPEDHWDIRLHQVISEDGRFTCTG